MQSPAPVSAGEGTPREPADEELMALYAAGDADAFDTLYGRFRGPLFRYLLRHCESEGAAEELFQETWLRVVRARQGWRPQAAFAPWLFRIARNLLTDHWRQRPPASEPIDESVVDLSFPWPEAWALVRDCVERLLKLLSGLAQEQRDGRFGTPEEFGAICAFLCSVHAGYMTGQNLLADGGAFPGTF